MRSIFIIISFAFLISCNKPAEIKQFIPGEYNCPDDSLLIGKIFIYEDAGTNKVIYHYEKLINTSLGRASVSKDYENGKMYCSSICLNGKLIEAYLSPFHDNQLFKREIIQDTLINNGTRLGQSVTKTVLRNNEYQLLITEISEYLKDTLLVWHNKSTPCLITSSKVRVESGYSKGPVTDTMMVYYNFYHCKNLGVVKYTVSDIGGFHSFILKDKIKSIQ